MSTVADLWAVQITDLSAEAIRQRLGELEKQLVEPDDIQAMRTEVAEAIAELTRWRDRQRAVDTEIRDLLPRIQAAERDLMSGRVRIPKELAAMGANVESLRRHQAALEDELLEALLEVERWQQALDQRQGQLAGRESAWRAEQEALFQERERSLAALKSLGARLQRQWASLSSTDQELYRTLRTRKRGRALALLRGDACGGCGMVLATGIIQQARNAEQDGQRVFCPSCGRLLHSQA
jgi:predicted  nucleic acid-binding Zn-ribbon protein